MLYETDFKSVEKYASPENTKSEIALFAFCIASAFLASCHLDEDLSDLPVFQLLCCQVSHDVDHYLVASVSH